MGNKDLHPNDGEYILRAMLAIRHGCNVSAMYTDDGELQCSLCLIDFRRDTPQQIQGKLFQVGMEKLARAQEAKEKIKATLASGGMSTSEEKWD